VLVVKADSMNRVGKLSICTQASAFHRKYATEVDTQENTDESEQRKNKTKIQSFGNLYKTSKDESRLPVHTYLFIL